MNTMRCIVVDDEPLARRGMLEYIGNVQFLQVVGVFEDAKQVQTMLQELETDLIFLDIEMPKLSGIDFTLSLKEPPLIIFTTAYPDYALKGYELNIVDYLVKPISFERFLKAVGKAQEIFSARQAAQSSTASNDYFFVKENGRYIRIFYKEVLYVEALQNYAAIYLGDRKVISYITLSILEKQFPANQFLRVHKSFIISLSAVDGIEGNLAMIGDKRIPVSRNTKEILLQKVLEHKLLKR